MQNQDCEELANNEILVIWKLHHFFPFNFKEDADTANGLDEEDEKGFKVILGDVLIEHAELILVLCNHGVKCASKEVRPHGLLPILEIRFIKGVFVISLINHTLEHVPMTLRKITHSLIATLERFRHLLREGMSLVLPLLIIFSILTRTKTVSKCMFVSIWTFLISCRSDLS